jgi:flagella basal body P-ring formation protein FlgA
MRLGLLILLLMACRAPGVALDEAALPVAARDGVVTREAILASARAFFAGDEDEVRLEALQVPRSIALRGSRSRLLAPQGDASTIAGSVRLALVEDIGGIQHHVAWITLAVRRFATVLVAARNLCLHEVLSGEDILQERRETTLLGRGVLGDPSALEGKRTQRVIAEGSILFDTMFEPEPVVVHGQQLRLRVLAGAVVLTLPVVAREDGCLGETISVQKVGSSERLMATVAGERTVEIVVR